MIATTLALSGCQVITRTDGPRSCADGGNAACDHLNSASPTAGMCWRCAEDLFCRQMLSADAPDCHFDAGVALDGGSSTDDAGMIPCGPELACADDGLFCNGSETCVSSSCEHVGDPCASGAQPLCDEDEDQCVECLESSDCPDVDFCDGTPICNLGTCGPSGIGPCGDTAGAVCSEEENTCLLPSRVFITAEDFNGDFDRHEVAINRCNVEGRPVLGATSSFLPWISFDDYEPAEDIRALIGDLRRVTLANGTFVANNWTDLTDGALLTPINRVPDGSSLGGEVWTATATNGTQALNMNCGDWTESGSTTGQAGIVASDLTWTNVGLRNCSEEKRLYCFEVFPQDVEAKRVFVTSEQYRPGIDFTSVDTAEDLCEAVGDAAVGDADWDVWLSQSAFAPAPTPAMRFTDFEGPYVLLDGRLLAFGFDDLIDSFLIDSINVDENGGTVAGDPIYVWTGANNNGTAGMDSCSEWTSSSAGSEGVVGNAAIGSDQWSFTTELSCDQMARLYCFEQ